MTNKPHPEYARLLRLSSTLRRHNSPLEYNIEFHIFDATPGRFKYRHRHKVYKVRQEITGIDNQENGSAEIKDVEMDNVMLPVSVAEIKKESTSTPALAHNLQNPIIRSNSISSGSNRKEKIPSAINIGSMQTFNTSMEIQSVFKILQVEIAALIQKDVFIDVSKISDISSPHLVHCTSEIKSVLPIKIQKIRNGNLNPREIEREIKLPINVNGKLAIVLEFRDEIKYDKYFENPFISSTLNHRVMSNLVIDHLTHNAKCDIDCVIDGLVSKIKCTFQGHRNYRPRKKVQKPEINNQVNNQLPVEPQQQHVSVIQPVIKTEILPQPQPQPQPQLNSNNVPSISNIVMNVNNSASNSSMVQDSMHNGMNFTQQLPPQQTYSYPLNSLPQFNVPVSQQYSSPNIQQNTQFNPCYTPAIQIPPQFTNGAAPQPPPPPPAPPQYQQQPPPSVLQGQEPYICNPPNSVPSESVMVSPNRVKPKVEILAIENVSSVKIDVNNITGMKKISFSNPCVAPKEEPSNGFSSNNNNSQQHLETPSVSVMTIEKPAKQEAKLDDELVDFEDEIQTTMVASTLPKKPIHLITESRSLPSMQVLPKSPPPLHYPVTKSETNVTNNASPSMPKEVISTTPQNTPQIRPNVIKVQHTEKVDDRCKKVENPTTTDEATEAIKKKKIELTHKNIAEFFDAAKKKLIGPKKRTSEVVIDLTEDVSFPSIDLTDEEDRRMRIAKRSNIPDITFVGCDTESQSSASFLDDEEFLRDSQERARKKFLKRSSSTMHHDNVRNCKVYLVDVMKDIDKNFLKKDTSIRLQKTLTVPEIEVGF